MESAFAIWHIQDAITAPLTFRDFHCCVLVSKSWHQVFLSKLWRVIQLGRQRNYRTQDYRIDPDSALLRRHIHLVQEIYVQRSGQLPQADGPSVGASVVDAEECGEIESGSNPGATPLFPDLRILNFWPCRKRNVRGETGREVKNLLRFIELHETLEEAWLSLSYLNEAIFERLCQVIENHPRLRRIGISDFWMHSAEHYQRFIWACRRLNGNNMDTNGGSAFSGLGTYPDMRCGCAIQLRSRYDLDDDLQHDQGPVPGLTFKTPTKIRSLQIELLPQGDISILFPILEMCPLLNRLDIEMLDPDEWLSDLRDSLHENCPNLSHLKISSNETHGSPMGWVLKLLDPFAPIEFETEDGDVVSLPGKAPPDATRSSEHGFRLKTLFIEDINVKDLYGIELPDWPNVYHGLLFYHGPTLTELDLAAIALPLQEFVIVHASLPGLELLRASVVWTIESSDRTHLLVGFQDLQLDEKEDEYSYSSTRGDLYSRAGYEVGLLPWKCRRLQSLEISVRMESLVTFYHFRNEPPTVESKKQLSIEKMVGEYFVREIDQLAQLEDVAFSTDSFWSPALGKYRDTKIYPHERIE